MTKSLSNLLTSEEQHQHVVDDCQVLIDEEVSSKSGLSGMAIKAGYRTIKGVKPGFVQKVVRGLLPEFAEALDPIYQEAKREGEPVAGFFSRNSPRVADALLTITDDKAKRSDSSVIRGTYKKLRGSAKKNVESAVPRLGRLIEKYGG